MNRIVLLACLATLWIAQDAGAQTIRGLLLDSETSVPIVNGTVNLLDSADSTVATAISNDRGEFLLRAPHPGEFRLAGQRIGYAPGTSSPIDVAEGEVVEVVFRLSVEATLLDPITAVARRGTGLTPGSIVNSDRRARGLGVFLTQDEVLARSEQDTRDALRDVEGIRVGTGRGGPDCGLGRERGSGIPLWDGLCLISSRGWGCMTIVVNELPLPDGFDLSTLIPHPQQVAGIEVYRTYREVPDELKFLAWPAQQRESCGLVAIWTHAAW